MERILLNIEINKDDIKEALRMMFEAQKLNAADLNIKSCGELTRTVLSLAREGNVHLSRDLELMKYLAGLEALKTVPRRLYPAVAEVFANIYRTTEESRKIN